MKDPSTPDSSGFFVKPSKKYTSEKQSKKCQREDPPTKPWLKYCHMVEGKHECTENICSYFWDEKHFSKDNTAKEKFFKKRIPEHDVEKNEEKCRLIDASSFHTRTDCPPIYRIPEENIGQSNNNHWKESKSGTKFPGIRTPFSKLSDTFFGKISDTQRNEKKKCNL